MADITVNWLVEKQKALSLQWEEVDDSALPTGLRQLRLSTRHGTFNVLVDDEYDDIRQSNPACALNVVLLSGVEIQDLGPLGWYKQFESQPPSPGIITLINGTLNFYHDLKRWFDEEPKIIEPLAWQLNEGPARELRNLDR